MKEVFVVIAAFNEEKRIECVIKDLQENGYKNIIVVDDGSKDNTYSVAEKAGAEVLQLVFNRGQGAALQTGITHALREGAEYIVTFDADGQHMAKEIASLLEPVAKGEADVALGSRFLRKCNIPFKRKVLLKGALLVQRFFYGVKTTDVHNGFRVFSRKAASEMKITCDRMAHASEIIEEIHRKKLVFKEVPVNIRYNEEVISKGHGSYMQAIRVLYSMILKRLTK